MTSTLNERLIQYLLKHQHSVFQYNVHDCRTFAARWVDQELDMDYETRIVKFIKTARFSKLVMAINDPGGYARLIKEVSGVEGTKGPGKLGDIVVAHQVNGQEILGIQSVRLVHLPGRDCLEAIDSRAVIEHWSLECLKQ
jgi:hypothetical protein